MDRYVDKVEMIFFQTNLVFAYFRMMKCNDFKMSAIYLYWRGGKALWWCSVKFNLHIIEVLHFFISI